MTQFPKDSPIRITEGTEDHCAKTGRGNFERGGYQKRQSLIKLFSGAAVSLQVSPQDSWSQQKPSTLRFSRTEATPG